MDEETLGYLQYLEAETSLKREEILVLMEEKIASCGGIITEYGALYAVGRAHKVNITDVYEHARIKDLQAGEAVTLTAKVKVKAQAREFKRKDGTMGQYAALTIADHTGVTRLLLWETHAATADQLNVGDTIKVTDARAKEYNGRTELHTTPETKITVNSAR
jgi:ssDNA-binding replication factor A large subunit